MATHAPITGAPMRALSNVVRLPSAPKLKVQQNRNRAAYAEREKLPQHPAEYLFPGQRRALRRAERLARVPYTPELVIAGALYGALDEEARRRVLLGMAPLLAAESEPCRDAVEVLLSATMTVGERVDLDWAMARLSRVR